MLLLYKEGIALEVLSATKRINFLPLSGRFIDHSLLNTISRTEERLVQLCWDGHAEGDTPSLLKTYFMEKGGQVKER